MSRKPPSIPDFDLWNEVARGVKPLGLKTHKRALTPKPLSAATPLRANSSLSPVLRKPSGKTPPPLAAFDRRTEQKLQRGQAEIDARIDLHGSTVELARIRLLDYLTKARFSGARLVLVITGKGSSPFSSHMLHGRDPYHAPERGGVLRKSLSIWLSEPEFRHHVIGFQPAHPRHGGGGAFYVKLRRKGGHDP